MISACGSVCAPFSFMWIASFLAVLCDPRFRYWYDEFSAAFSECRTFPHNWFGKVPCKDKEIVGRHAFKRFGCDHRDLHARGVKPLLPGTIVYHVGNDVGSNAEVV